MNPGIYMMTIMVLPVTAMIVFAMKYASSYAAAQARSVEDANVRVLMASNGDQIATIGTMLKAVAEEQARQSQTLASINAMLKEVG